MDHPLIAALGISKTLSAGRRRHKILGSVSLSVWRHKIVTVWGPNGSGKSTLLSLLAGLREPDPLSPPIQRNCRRIGYVPQSPLLGLRPWANAVSNLRH